MPLDEPRSTRPTDQSNRSIPRRRFLRRAAALSVGATALGLLQACAPAAAPSPTAAPAQAPAAAAPAPTTAPAAPQPAARPGAAVAPAPQATVATAADKPAPGGAIRVGTLIEVRTLDPHKSSSGLDYSVFTNIYDGLFTINTKNEIVPVLVEAWEQKDDVTYVFKLRKGVKFQDGTDFNAGAVKFNMDRMIDPKTAFPRISDIDALKTTEVVDDFTVKMTLKTPFSPFIAGLGGWAGKMVSPTAVEKAGKDYGTKVAVGTGPFTFAEWVKDDHLTMKKFDGYWDKSKVNLDQITFKPVLDDSVKLTNLLTGNLDMIDSVPPKDVGRIKADPSVQYQEVPSWGWYHMTLQCEKPPFDKPELRQAVYHAIDLEAIQKTLFFGTGAVGVGPISPGHWAYTPDVKPQKRDVAKAKERLAKAGVPNGFKFTNIVRNTPIFMQIAQAFKAQLAEVGIDMDMNVMDYAAIGPLRDEGKFDAYMAQWTGYYEPHSNIYSSFFSGGSMNYSRWKYPSVDEMLTKAAQISDQNERKRLYGEAQKIIVDQVPRVFTHHYALNRLMSKKVQGYVLTPENYLDMREVWLKK